jgi:hypothetical protein
MGKSSKIRAVAGVGDPSGGISNVLFPAAMHIRQEANSTQYGLPVAALPSVSGSILPVSLLNPSLLRIWRRRTASNWRILAEF